MKKFLLATVALIAFTATANAAPAQKNTKAKNAPVQTKEVQAESNFRPYVSVKGAYAKTAQSAVKIAGRTEDAYWGSESYGHKEKINDHTYGVRVAVGTKVGTVRSELEFGWNERFSERYSNDDMTWKNTFQTKTVMLNGYYDLFTNNGFTPYIGAGIGLSHNKLKIYDSSLKASDDAFAWQVGAGVTYDICDNMAIDIGYRYMDYGSVRKKYIESDDGFYEHDNIKAKLKANEVLVGVRYSF